MTQRPLHQRALYGLVRVLAVLVGKCCFGLRIDGRQHWPREGGVLVCANHQSSLDPVLVGMTCSRRMNFLARKTLFQNRAFAWLIRAQDAIPVDREGSGFGGLKESLRRLRRGELVLIFPEGTRTPDGIVQPLKPGFVAMARRSGVPIVPVGIEGAFQAWPKGRKLPRCTRVAVVVGPPVSAERMQSLDDAALVQCVADNLRAVHEAAKRLRGC